MSQALPIPPTSFVQKKAKILAQLAVPDSDYSDASPKGSVDEGIRDLIDELNTIEGLVTTSSCAGRVSVFLEGRKDSAPSGDEQIAGVGGKGGGGTWLYVSHDPVRIESHDEEDIRTRLGLSEPAGTSKEPGQTRRLIHFKFEPMILHILTASLEHAQLLLRCGLQAGFRESGAVSLTPSKEGPSTPMVAIRSMGLGFESLVGYEVDGRRECFHSPEYLATLVGIANERFGENTRRIDRFRDALRDAVEALSLQGKNADGSAWEDPAVRRERKRAEGLRIREQMGAQRERGRLQEAPINVELEGGQLGGL